MDEATLKTQCLEALKRACDAAESASRLARLLKQHSGKRVYPQLIDKWLKVGRVPAEWCRDVEFVTNKAVTRYELRPDVFGESSEDEVAA